MAIAEIHGSALRAFDMVGKISVNVAVVATFTMYVHTNFCSLPLYPSVWLAFFVILHVPRRIAVFCFFRHNAYPSRYAPSGIYPTAHSVLIPYFSGRYHAVAVLNFRKSSYALLYVPPLYVAYLLVLLLRP